MIVFTRKYTSANVIKNENGLDNVITSVYCICRGEDDVSGVFETIAESIVMDPPISSNFINFDELTEEIIESWVINKPQYLELEEKVRNGIVGRINPPIEDKPLPFNQE